MLSIVGVARAWWRPGVLGEVGEEGSHADETHQQEDSRQRGELKEVGASAGRARCLLSLAPTTLATLATLTTLTTLPTLTTLTTLTALTTPTTPTTLTTLTWKK